MLGEVNIDGVTIRCDRSPPTQTGFWEKPSVMLPEECRYHGVANISDRIGRVLLYSRQSFDLSLLSPHLAGEAMAVEYSVSEPNGHRMMRFVCMGVPTFDGEAIQ